MRTRRDTATIATARVEPPPRNGGSEVGFGGAWQAANGLAEPEIPRSGKPEELVEWAGISAKSIVAAVKG